MARKISRANGASWGTGKGLWGNLGSAWLPAKKAWANNGGVWTQAWPPDTVITFSVTATTGEVFYTSSDMTWAVPVTSFTAGTVTFERRLGAGAWTEFYSTTALSGTVSLGLTPSGASLSGTWYYRAKFVPSVDTGSAYYSAEDSVSINYRNRTLVSATWLMFSATSYVPAIPTTFIENPSYEASAPVKFTVGNLNAYDAADAVGISISALGWRGGPVYSDGSWSVSSSGYFTGNTISGVASISRTGTSVTFTMTQSVNDIVPFTPYYMDATNPLGCPAAGTGMNSGPVDHIQFTITFSDGSTTNAIPAVGSGTQTWV